ncbi:MAG TPA: leishmanolysin-related zinc metalloendopeptidase [Gemmatimonadaceae bacterium]|nr:leishmanolysin-related zinc metalloendopeptidase [Gemmatimonadaceae bacterium]
MQRALAVLAVSAVGACSSGDSAGPATAVAIVYVGNPALSAIVGQAVAPSPQIEIRDADGNALSGRSFSVAVTAGGGAVVGTPVKTTSGSTSIGTWTLGTTAGAHALTVSSGSLAPLVINATGTPGAANTSTSGGGPLTASGTVGTASVITPSIKVMDAFGNAIANVDVTTTVLGGGSIQTPNPTTNASGIASAGTWTLGGAAGNQSVTLTAAGAPPVTFTVLAGAGPPSSSTAQTQTTGTGVPTTLASFQPTIRVLDAFGNGIPGLVVATTVSASGSLQFPAPATNALGIATVGNWTLGPNAGDNVVTMTAGSLPAVTFTVTTSGSAPPASITIVAGQFQTASPSAALNTAPVFRVKNALGNPLPGATVQFQVLSGGGSVVSSNVVADAQGDASPGAWTLGSVLGAQRLRATAGGIIQTLYATALAPAGGSFNLEVRYVGTPPSAAIQSVFTDVVNRLQAQLVADIPQQFVNDNVGLCMSGAPSVNETIDDLLVFVRVGPIDGVNGVLGQAGPCFVRPGLSFPVIGILELDEADAANLLAQGKLHATALHEMHHVLGLGTYWSQFAAPLIQGAGTSEPTYLGAAGNAAYVTAGGTFVGGIRIENSGPQGTRDGHWRESLFDAELMTGFDEAGAMPLSAFSIMSLADFGYSVSTAGADPYTVPLGALRGAQQAIAPTSLKEVLIRPTHVVRPDGRAMKIVNGPLIPSR